jgi:hypothetical protein
MNMTELTILEELKTLLPPLSAEEFAGLEESILKDGCLSDLIAWGDILIDGHNRYEICRKHQIPFGIKSIHFESLDDAKFWIWKHQESRRNLTAYHRAEIALKLKDVIAARAKERQIRKSADSVPVTLPEQKETRQELAELAGIGSRTLDKAEYITEHADEETKAKLRRGEKGTSIHKEYNRLKEDKKSTTTKSKSSVADSEPAQENKKQDATSDSAPLAGEQAGFLPGSPEEEKYSAKTTLKPIPRNRPDVLVRNLLTHFPREFVPNMVRVTFQILVDIGEKDQAKALASEVYKQFGRK